MHGLDGSSWKRLRIKRALATLIAELSIAIALATLLPVVAQGQETLRDGAETPLNLSEADPAVLEQLRAMARARLDANKTDVAEVRGVVRSVSLSASCPTGYIRSRRLRTSEPDVEIVNAAPFDCDGASCRAIQIDARRDSPAPFDVSIALTCSG